MKQLLSASDTTTNIIRNHEGIIKAVHQEIL